MSNYEVYLLSAVFLLLVSLISGFSAVTNRRSVGFAMVLFVLGGFALFQASTMSAGGNLAADLPGAIYKLYAKVMR